MASSKYDGHVRIDTRLDTDAFEQGIDEINKGLENTEKSINSFGSRLKNLFSLNTIHKFCSMWIELLKTKEVKEAEAEINNLSTEVNKLFSEDFGKVKDEIEANTKAIDEQKKNVDNLNRSYKKERDIAAEIEAECQKLYSKPGNNEKLAQLNELKDALKEMQNKGFYFGDAEFDAAYIGLKELEKEVKIYRQDLDSTATNGIFSNKLTEELYEAKNALESLKNQGLSFGDADFDAAYSA